MDLGTLELKINECFKWDLVSHPSRNMEDTGTEGDLNSWGLAQEVPKKRNVFMWPRDCFVIFLGRM